MINHDYMSCLKKHSLHVDRDHDAVFITLYAKVGEDKFVEMLLRKDLVIEFMTILPKVTVNDFSSFQKKSSLFVESDIVLFKFMLNNLNMGIVSLNPKLVLALQDADQISSSRICTPPFYFLVMLLTAVMFNYDV